MNMPLGTRGFSLPLLLLTVCLAASCTDAAGPDPVLLEVLAGDGQEAQIGTPVAAALIVHVMGLDSVPREGIPVEWTVVQGGGTIEPSAGSSDAEGRAQASWTLGSQVGEQLVRASVGGESVEWNAWADPPPPDHWSEVVAFRPTTEIEGTSMHARLRLYNQWAGRLRMKTMTGCFNHDNSPALYAESGELVDGIDYFCTYAVRSWTLQPADSLGWDSTFDITSVLPGQYTVRWRFAVVEINGASDTLPNVETSVSLGG